MANAELNRDDTAQEQQEPPTLDAALQENARLREQVANLEQAVGEQKEIEDRLRRTAAHYENIRRRAERDLEDTKKFAVERLAKKMLPVWDNLERALEAVKTNPDSETLRQGVEMVRNQLADALASEGVKPLESVGKPFDPNLHEAIAQHPTNDVAENTVVSEMQRGYLLNDRLLRAASVLVATKPSE